MKPYIRAFCRLLEDYRDLVMEKLSDSDSKMSLAQLTSQQTIVVDSMHWLSVGHALQGLANSGLLHQTKILICLQLTLLGSSEEFRAKRRGKGSHVILIQ